MKNKKGFTLVELLAVIVIISIVLIIFAPTLTNSINNKKQDASSAVEKLVLSSGQTYAIDNNLQVPLSIPIEELCNYIDCPIIDPYTNEEIKGYVVADQDNNYSIVKGKVVLDVNYNGGTPSQTLETEYSPYFTITIAPPVKEGFNFSHWEVTKGNGIVDGNKVTVGNVDTEIYAMWVSWPILTVDYDGGTPGEELNEKYKTGTIIELETPTKTGYTFAGWEKVNGNSVLSGSTLTIGTEDTKIRAKWTANSYTITYYIGNGTETAGVTKLGTSTCTYNEQCTLKSFDNLGGIFPYSSADNTANGKTNYNWSFYGWGTSQTTTSRTYADKGTFTYSTVGNINLYAIGRKPFYINGGIAPTSTLKTLYQYWNPYSTSTTYLTSITLPSATAISGWTFVGYRTGSNLASWVESTTAVAYGTTGVITIPASVVSTAFKPQYNSWGTARSVYKRTVKLQYNANGGSGTIAAQEVTQYYNSGYASSGANNGATLSTPTFTLPSSGVTKTYYTLNKWAAGSTSGTQYATGASYTAFKPAVDSTTTTQTMYAIYRANRAYVKFHVNGGTITASTTNADGTTTYAWTTSSSVIARNGSQTFYSIAYGSTGDLPNYNNKYYMNITRSGYTAPDGAEWICSSGCSTANKTYDHSVAYSPSDFCNLANGDCTATVKVNWKAATPVGLYTCANTSAGSGTKVLTYTGDCTVINDGSGNWRVKFLTSGTLKLTSSTSIDAFLVGGGGGGGTNGTNSANKYYYDYKGGGGGGGGYTLTKKQITLNANTNYTINIGDGGIGGKSPTNGASTTAFGYTASGGNAAITGDGGSGGSAGGRIAENGASNGQDSSISKGQISTSGPNGETGNTYEFGETGTTLYAGGGGGGGAYHSTSDAQTAPGTGGSGGGGNGSYYLDYYGEVLYDSGVSDTNGVDNTGGGGGGSTNTDVYPAGNGGSGIVVIRNAR